MNDTISQIRQRLADMQRAHDCRLLFAAESGSRSWGHASQNSDYDVRCVYYHPQACYLRVYPPRDTIEWELNEVFDINGWDLRKALHLALKSNVSIHEWAHSPIMYETSPHVDEFRALIERVMQPERLAYRYVGMAVSTFKRYLEAPQVPYKEYFYCIRPLLAARWVLRERRPAPVPFAELREALLPADMQDEVDTLLQLRANSTEKAMGPVRPVAAAFIQREIESLRATLDAAPDLAFPDPAPLDDFFRRVVAENGD